MSDVKLVKARWVAPFVGEMPGVPELIPGETIVELPEPEAEASDNWAVVGGKRAKTRKASAKKTDDTPVAPSAEPISEPPAAQEGDS